MIRASIIIPTRNRRERLRALLNSLRQSSCGRDDVEIIVADDGSTDGTGEMVAAEYPEVLLCATPQPGGPSRARNCAAALSQGQLLVFLDDDGEVAGDWLKALLAADTGSHILLGNVVDYRGGRVQSVPRRATFIGKSLPCRDARANTGPSCNLAIPRACFQALGGFDEELPYYFEDSDLCLRARRAGFPFTFVRDAVFRHHGTEHKHGDAIRMQERNSTYAMLKFYEDDIPRSLAFSLANGSWMAARLLAWLARGRITDAGGLLAGWASAYTRYIGPRL